MRIEAKYSHLNGEEFLLVHRPERWAEIKKVIAEVDAEKCHNKESLEKTMPGRMLYSPRCLNQKFKDNFALREWTQERHHFWVTSDQNILRRTHLLPAENQKRIIEEAGLSPIGSYNQTDFVKDRIAVEVQFGKYAFVAHDLFVKHMSFFVSDRIDVGIEILPMKELEREMSSGVPYYERDLLNVLRQGRGVPAVPLVLIGVAP